MENVTVNDLPGMTEHVRVLAWPFDLDPDSENSIKTGHKLSLPPSIRLSQIE
jgi:hypothetical protein